MHDYGKQRSSKLYNFESVLLHNFSNTAKNVDCILYQIKLSGYPIYFLSTYLFLWGDGRQRGGAVEWVQHR